MILEWIPCLSPYRYLVVDHRSTQLALRVVVELYTWFMFYLFLTVRLYRLCVCVMRVCFWAGHHHYNDQVVEQAGMLLCYGRVSGHTPPSDYEGSLRGPIPFQRGIRAIRCKFHSNGSCLETWIENTDQQEVESLVTRSYCT